MNSYCSYLLFVDSIKMALEWIQAQAGNYAAIAADEKPSQSDLQILRFYTDFYSVCTIDLMRVWFKILRAHTRNHEHRRLSSARNISLSLGSSILGLGSTARVIPRNSKLSARLLVDGMSDKARSKSLGEERKPIRDISDSIDSE